MIIDYNKKKLSVSIFNVYGMRVRHFVFSLLSVLDLQSPAKSLQPSLLTYEPLSLILLSLPFLFLPLPLSIKPTLSPHIWSKFSLIPFYFSVIIFCGPALARKKRARLFFRCKQKIVKQRCITKVLLPFYIR